MNDRQYLALCLVFNKELTAEDLEEMGFSAHNGEYDDDLEYDLSLFEMDQRRNRNDS